MTWMNLSRAAKVLALLMFLLPWMAVSCNGTPLAEATGVDLVLGKMEPAADSPMAQMAQQAEQNGGADAEAIPNDPTGDNQAANSIKGSARYWVPAGLAVILLGLVLGFVLRPARQAAMGALVASLAALAILGGGMAWTTSSFKAEMQKAVAEQGAPDTSDPFGESAQKMAAAMAQAIRLDVKVGYWLTLVFLGLAAGGAGLALSGRGIPGLTITVGAPATGSGSRSDPEA